MIRSTSIVLVLCATWIHGCAAGTSAPPHGLSTKPFPLPTAPAVPSGGSLDSVERDVAALQPAIGMYPPRFASEEHRDEVHARWRSALVAARSLDARGDQLEQKLHLLGELYRQGHNLDVVGAANEALATLERCIEMYPRSRRCHLSASYFYLSASGIPSRLERTERSLTVLRELAAPAMDDDAEAGFIWLAIYRDDMNEARRLIDCYAAAFPESSRTEMFRRIQGARDFRIMHREGP